ncbi:MAG: hypothetical protein ACKKMS_02500 [Candidatus Nealsonbacteria bacterium]
MTISDFVKDLKNEGLNRKEALEIFESWLDENIGLVLRDEAIKLFEKHYE